MNLHHHQDIFTTLSAPTYYPLQCKMGYCGPYQIKAVVESESNQIDNARSYTANFFGRLIGGMTPWSMYRVLKKKGFHPHIGFLKGNRDMKIEKIKTKLKAGPIILLIGHAYNHRYKFNLMRALLFNHYISIRGFNDQEQVFYVYDSNPHKDIDNKIPVGNISIPYKYLIRYGKYPLAGLIRNLYISLG